MQYYPFSMTKFRLLNSKAVNLTFLENQGSYVLLIDLVLYAFRITTKFSLKFRETYLFSEFLCLRFYDNISIGIFIGYIGFKIA